MAQAQLNSMLELLRSKRVSFKKMTAFPKDEPLVLKRSKRGGKKVKPKLQQLPFKMPTFTTDLALTPRLNEKWSVNTVVELYNEVHHCWVVGRLTRNAYLPKHVRRMDVFEFEKLSGVKVRITRRKDLDSDHQRFVHGMPVKAYQIECCLVDPRLPLGMLVSKIINEQDRVQQELEKRRQLRFEASQRINQAILNELPDLVDGGIRAVDFPVYHTELSDEGVEHIAGYDAGF